MFKRVYNSICRFWFFQKLRWQYKGKKETFPNYLDFLANDYFDKIIIEGQDNPEVKTIIQRAKMDPIYRERHFSGWRLQIEEFRTSKPVGKLGCGKTVRETILDAVRGNAP